MSHRLRLSLAAWLLWVLASPAIAGEGLRCTTCDAAIRGEYVVYDELGWSLCSRCASAPECEGCRLPRAGRNEGDDGWCARCVRSAEACTACGRPILERYWQVRGVEGKFCSRCRQEAPPCASCGAPARDGRLADGRIFCRACRPLLVNDPAVCAELYRDVVRRAEQVLGMTLNELPRLQVHGQSGLRDGVAAGLGKDGSDLCGLFVRDEEGAMTIHLLSNLTESRATAVLAHELAHAWQAESCPDNQGLRMREGFAEWVAWKILASIPGGDAERRAIEARTDEYGLGFRFFADLEARDGAEGALRYAVAARSSL
ncbi:MAG TPA: hypothetical protein VKU85_19565 [bacterium]|nr:hypothetical protein [bacterium]